MIKSLYGVDVTKTVIILDLKGVISINNLEIMNKFKRLRDYFTLHEYKLLVNDIVDNVYVRKDLFDVNDKNVFSKCIRFPQY